MWFATRTGVLLLAAAVACDATVPVAHNAPSASDENPPTPPVRVDAAVRGAGDAAATVPPDAAAPPNAVAPSDAATTDGPTAIGDGSAAPTVVPVLPVLPVLPTVVPVLWLEAGGKNVGSSPVKVPGRLKVIEDHDGSGMGLAQRPATVDVPMGIGLRGDFSSALPKKPYGIELRDAAGMDKEYPILGMPAGSDFALYACYTDKTCMRNAIVYDLGQSLGRWNPRFRFVEAYLDGKYVGLYNLIEAIKRDKNRVNVPKPGADAATGDVTGGYIFRHEGGGKGITLDWKSTGGLVWTFKYPRVEDLTIAQRSYLVSYVNDFEAAMRAPGWASAETGYRTWFDVPSAVDYVIVQEVTNNWDGYARSVYFTKEPKAAGNRLYAAPLWDYDLAFGNASLGDNFRTDTWAYKNARTDVNAVLFFFKKLWGDAAFQADVRCRWKELRRGPLARATLDGKMTAWAKYIGPSWTRDQARWPTLGTRIFPNYYVGKTYDAEVAWLRDWIAKRLAWLDTNLPGACPTGN